MTSKFYKPVSGPMSHPNHSFLSLINIFNSSEWVKKTLYIYTMEYYITIKRGNAVVCSNMNRTREY